MDYFEYYRARDILHSLLRKDLLGPVTSDEILEEAPQQSYITGRLFPRDMFINQQENEKNNIEEIDENEQTMNMCYAYYPSSMALSFTVIPDASNMEVEIKYARYVPELSKIQMGHRPQCLWHRQFDKQTFVVTTGDKEQTFPVCEGLELRVYLQHIHLDGAKTITIALVNVYKGESDYLRNNEHTFFQPEIIVRSCPSGKGIFLEKQMRVELNINNELLNMNMLYNHCHSFATGHGCSVNWINEGEYAIEVFSEFIPFFDVLQMRPALKIRKNIRKFSYLSSASTKDICKGLNEIPDAYNTWIEDQKNKIKNIPSKYHRIAFENLEQCRESSNRIRAGIDLLKTDKYSFQAFQLLNQAMLDQRIKSIGKMATEASWFPFQLAFILQEIPSIADPKNKYREIVDLLWFPTGGGKTEAYLGLMAFTVFLRRLTENRNNRPGNGVTAIMRYTLRLLTLQQFERAAAIICACELIRQANSSILGNDEISIGMWVGYETTPTKRKEAYNALEIIKNDGIEGLKRADPPLANPVQVLECPWCKHKLTSADYKVSDRLTITCPNCEFHNGLPVYLVDEDIYDVRPSLIVATVDKFARMTWQPLIGRLFGLDQSVLPPELIIQDELHLIAGPLGTITGLYEVAIDQFCKKTNIRAKIISSTATIRNAGSQINNLFSRDFRQFPPQGLDIRDSFFAEEAGPDEKPSRKYMSILAPGSSGNTVLIRSYAVLLFGIRYLVDQELPPEVINSFWTLTGYFNSLKQLGGAVINVIDDVNARIKFLQAKRFADILKSKDEFAVIKPPEELNSRKSSSEIASTLKLLETNYPASDAIDVVLASNMLSVGIDISRLGLMVLQGQPKLNSEYIQATSRVGRQTPGLVIMLNDASRSRDRSHYEQFKDYHSTLYKYVEATSLTPFADRARDRALHAVLISLCRQMIPGLRENNDARNIENYHEEACMLIKKILERVSYVDSDEYMDTNAHLNTLLEYWETMANRNHRLVYQKYRGHDTVPLLTMRFDSEGEAIPTLNSMRNVDMECNVKLLEGRYGF